MILIVDDCPDQRALLQFILKSAGHAEVRATSSAHEAFELLNLDEPDASDSAARLDLILMDVLMPEMTGIEACERLKADERLRDIPIIMVTAMSEAEQLQSAFEAGAVDYITKPVNKLELLARVGAALKLKREMDARKAREHELMELTHELAVANQRLERLSSEDGLTGVANRRNFDEVLDREWRRAARSGESLALIMIDIDHFKLYNDSQGHGAGDEALKQVAGALTQTVRRTTDLVARYGGEEFVVVMPTMETAEAAVQGERMRMKVAELSIPHPRSASAEHITLSLGVASLIPQREESAATLIAAADQALYQAKGSGRNCVRAYEPAELGRTVLIADDDPMICDLVSRIIGKLNCPVFVATDGDEALELAHRHHPDLLILDVLMPKKHGYAVCKELRSRREFDRSRILMLTAKTYAADRAQAEELGADAFLCKPFKVPDLIASVARLLTGPEEAKPNAR